MFSAAVRKAVILSPRKGVAPAAKLPISPSWGRWPAGQRGATSSAFLERLERPAGQRPPLSASPTSPPQGGRSRVAAGARSPSPSPLRGATSPPLRGGADGRPSFTHRHPRQAKPSATRGFRPERRDVRGGADAATPPLRGRWPAGRRGVL